MSTSDPIQFYPITLKASFHSQMQHPCMVCSVGAKTETVLIEVFNVIEFAVANLSQD